MVVAAKPNARFLNQPTISAGARRPLALHVIGRKIVSAIARLCQLLTDLVEAQDASAVARVAEVDQFKTTRPRELGRSIARTFENGVGVGILGRRREDFRLYDAIGVFQLLVRVAPPIGDRNGLENVAVIVYGKRCALRYPSIGAQGAVDPIELPFVVERESLPRVRVDDTMTVALARLEQTHCEVALPCRIRAVLGFGAVQRIDFLSQRTTFQAATGFTRLLAREAVRQDRVVEVDRVALSRLEVVFRLQMARETRPPPRKTPV